MNIDTWTAGDLFGLGVAFSLRGQIGGYSMNSDDINDSTGEATF